VERHTEAVASGSRPAVKDPPNTVLTAVSAQLLSLLSDATHLDTFLERVVHLATDLVSPRAACGLTIRRDEHPFSVVTSDDLAAQVDEIQYGGNEGPCLDSLRTGLVVQVDDLTQEDRWNEYRPHAIAHGVLSSLSLPLTVDGQTVAALHLYATWQRAFDGPQRQHAEMFAAQCAAALALALRQINQAQVQQQLLEAVTSRSIIDQAIGILMGQQRCTASVAFDLLRRASQHRNRKLRDIAADIVTNVTGEPPQPPADFKIG
jgi:GAF domain-containing protein